MNGLDKKHVDIIHQRFLREHDYERNWRKETDTAGKTARRRVQKTPYYPVKNRLYSVKCVLVNRNWNCDRIIGNLIFIFFNSL